VDVLETPKPRPEKKYAKRRGGMNGQKPITIQ